MNNIDNIIVYDNFLTDSELSNCVSHINNLQWKWGHTSNKNIINVPFWYMELSNIEYFTQYIKNKIEYITNKRFSIERVYANGQTYGQSGIFHQDNENTGFYTFCLYLSKVDIDLIDYIDGCIQFKIPDINKYTININTLFNRGIIFPSSYFHRGNSFSRFCNDLRVCIAWKLKHEL
jgi:hypothetical protein